jgi:hypothetical protein
VVKNEARELCTLAQKMVQYKVKALQACLQRNHNYTPRKKTTEQIAYLHPSHLARQQNQSQLQSRFSDCPFARRPEVSATAPKQEPISLRMVGRVAESVLRVSNVMKIQSQELRTRDRAAVPLAMTDASCPYWCVSPKRRQRHTLGTDDGRSHNTHFRNLPTVVQLRFQIGQSQHRQTQFPTRKDAMLCLQTWDFQFPR